MANDNVATVRNAYAVAEGKDLEGWINLFTPEGVFIDNSVGATYRGRCLADPVRNYGTAFSNMHRERSVGLPPPAATTPPTVPPPRPSQLPQPPRPPRRPLPRRRRPRRPKII
jgi:hypothetical protein